jgi:hypothetical protein
MNYLNYKKQFPKSIKLFFEWVSKQNPDNQNDYVDNVYFYQFFSEHFQYIQIPEGTLIIDEKKDYFTNLQSDLMLFRDNEKHNHLFDNNRIIFSNYTDTNKEYIRIIINSESSFGSAFFVLEKLIENEYYGSK